MRQFLFLLCLLPFLTNAQTQLAKALIPLDCDSFAIYPKKVIALPQSNHAILGYTYDLRFGASGIFHAPFLIITDKFGSPLSTTRLPWGIYASDLTYYDGEIFICGAQVAALDQKSLYLASLDLSGQVNWAHTYDSDSTQNFDDIVRINIVDGSIYLTQTYQGTYGGPGSYWASTFHLITQLTLSGTIAQLKFFGTSSIPFGEYRKYNAVDDFAYSTFSEVFAAVGVSNYSGASNHDQSTVHIFDPSLSTSNFYLDNSSVHYFTNYFDAETDDLIMAGNTDSIARITRLENSLNNVWSKDIDINGKKLYVWDVIPGNSDDIILIGNTQAAPGSPPNNYYQIAVIVFASNGNVKHSWLHVPLDDHGGIKREFYYDSEIGLVGIADVPFTKGSQNRDVPEIFIMNPYNPDLCIFDQVPVNTYSKSTNFQLVVSYEKEIEFETFEKSDEEFLNLISKNICTEADTPFFYVDTTLISARIAPPGTSTSTIQKPSLQEFQESNSILYPNPNSGTFKLNLSSYKNTPQVKLEIISLNGKLLQSETLRGGEQEAMVRHVLKSGVYLLRLNNRVIEKLMVE